MSRTGLSWLGAGKVTADIGLPRIRGKKTCVRAMSLLFKCRSPTENRMKDVDPQDRQETRDYLSYVYILHMHTCVWWQYISKFGWGEHIIKLFKSVTSLVITSTLFLHTYRSINIHIIKEILFRPFLLVGFDSILANTFFSIYKNIIKNRKKEGNTVLLRIYYYQTDQHILLRSIKMLVFHNLFDNMSRKFK